MSDPADQRLQRFHDACPLYQKWLTQHPEWSDWIASAAVANNAFGPGRLAAEWEAATGESVDFEALRVFRRRMSARIAYREVNELAPIRETLEELTWLAEFCIQKAFTWTREELENEFGVPWHASENRPCQFCVLAVGKLGAGELNFCSDVDLVYFFEGQGNCRRGSRDTALTNREFFNRLCRDATGHMTRRTQHGFLYNVDLRLRPEGDSGPLLQSLAGITNYYFSRGQTWERLVLLRARPVAGDRGLGEDFLEVTHAFRFPRHPPASLPDDVSAMKRRTEAEVVGTSRLEHDIKTGPGGIREIEFFTQVLQLTHAGRYPFLQTQSTFESLQQLARYEIIQASVRDELLDAYEFFRLLENRLQMEHERAVHTLPESPSERERLAHSLGFAGAQDLAERIAQLRSQVRAHYGEIFPREQTTRPHFADWMAWFSDGRMSPHVRDCLDRWFTSSEAVGETLGELVLGTLRHQVSREQVHHFLDLMPQLDSVLPQLADARQTVERISAFSRRYGAPRELLQTCSVTPTLFHILALLFDRSEFIYRLLCRHPEILEELLNRQIRRSKSVQELVSEMELGPSGDAFPSWLWLYVKAEQVRISINELLGHFSQSEAESQLTDLAEASVRTAARTVGAEEDLSIIALGKFGGREMTLGSDLDLWIVADKAQEPGLQRKARALVRFLGHKEPMGPLFEVDLRLRPFGDDGPLLVTPNAMQRYFESDARAWERQMLTRARALCGPGHLLDAFETTREDVVFGGGLEATERNALAQVRLRILEEKARVDPPVRAFKSGAGGLVDIEYLAQRLLLAHGPEMPDVRTTNTRQMLQGLGLAGVITTRQEALLLENYDFLRRVEFSLRRDTNTAADELPADDNALARLACWLNLADASELLSELDLRFRTTLDIIRDVDGSDPTSPPQQPPAPNDRD